MKLAPSVVAAAVLLTTASRASAGDVRQECVDAAERAQLLRDERSFVKASITAITCARPECPAVLQRDCSQLVEDLRARTPSIIIRVRTRGRDRFDATVTLDGKPVEITGATIPLDPGRHVLRAVSPGSRAAEQTVLAVEREQARVVELSLEDEPIAPRAVAEPEPKTPPPVTPPPASSRGVPTGAWIAGGIGLVGVAGFVYFGLKARSDIDYLTDTCSPRCTDEQISYPQAKRVAADVSLGVGVIGLGLATWFILRTPKRDVGVAFAPATGGGLATVSGAL